MVIYDTQPGMWQYRQKIEGTRKHIYKQLNEPDIGKAAGLAEENYLELEDALNPSSTPIKTCSKEWIKKNAERQVFGRLTDSCTKAKSSSLLTFSKKVFLWI